VLTKETESNGEEQPLFLIAFYLFGLKKIEGTFGFMKNVISFVFQYSNPLLSKGPIQILSLSFYLFRFSIDKATT
jgi:hypothetical protein